MRYYYIILTQGTFEETGKSSSSILVSAKMKNYIYKVFPWRIPTSFSSKMAFNIWSTEMTTMKKIPQRRDTAINLFTRVFSFPVWILKKMLEKIRV